VSAISNHPLTELLKIEKKKSLVTPTEASFFTLLLCQIQSPQLEEATSLPPSLSV